MLRESIYEALHSFTNALSELTALFSGLSDHNLDNPELSNALNKTLFASEQLTRQLGLLQEERPPLHRIQPQRINTAIIKISELTSKLTRLSNLPEFSSPEGKAPISPTSLLAIELTALYLSVELAFFTRLESDIRRNRSPEFQEIHHLKQPKGKFKFIELASARKRGNAPLFSRSTVSGTFLDLERSEYRTRSTPSNTTWNTFIPVFFATDRKYAEDSAPPRCQFLDRRGDNNLTYGIADVSIPPTHRRGQLERPFSLWKIQFKENVERHIVITSCNCLSIGDWKGNAIDKLAEMESKSALVFIHGFNVSFDDAIRQAAQIGFDLQLQSLITAYSWTSQGAVSNYAADEDSVKLTVPNFIDFLNTLTSIGITTIHVIAHSMGNRALVNCNT